MFYIKYLLYFRIIVTFFPVSSTYKTDCHDITEILLKVALNTITQTKPILTFSPGNKIVAPLRLRSVPTLFDFLTDFKFHFKYFIDKSIGLDNRLCLYKSSNNKMEQLENNLHKT
jgi:hypothetical protein